jgi:hypothetical protein
MPWRHLRAPALAALVVGLASLQVAWVIRQRDDDAIRAWSVARAREASVAIHARLQLFELAFDRMVRRQEFAPDPEAWRANADEQLETFPALVGIAWIGEGHVVRAATDPRVAAWCRPPDDEAFRTTLTRQVEAGRLYFSRTARVALATTPAR